MAITTFGQEMDIMLGKDDFVKVQVLDYEKFEKLKKATSLFRVETIKRDGISRTFENKAKEIFIEFYDRTVIHIKNKNDLQRLENVSFDASINWKLKVPIMSIVYVEENIFNELKADATLIEEVGELSSIGEFYQLPNGFVVFKWVDKYFNKGKYSIIEDIKNANALDIELFHEGFYEEGELEDSLIPEFKLKKIVYDEAFDKELWDGGKQNLEKLIYLMSEWFNIDKEELDFSEKSFDKIEESLWWNFRGNPYELVSPLTAYLGISLTRNHKEIKWNISDGGIGLESKKGELQDLDGEVAKYLIDTDYGIPQIKPVMENILYELGIR